MDIRRVTESYSVSPQIGPEDVAEIAAMGFRTIMCNRPDGESAEQPDFEVIAAAAREAGIETVYLPVISGQMTDDDAVAFGKAIDQIQAPVLAYCRTGTRCTALWSIDQGHRGVPVPQVVEAAREAGYDMSGLAPRIKAAGDRR